MKNNYISDFFSLIFPRICAACGSNLFKGENIICTKCMYDLPKTNFTDMKNNMVAELFWGRTNIEFATSFFYFTKGSKYQNILHNLKYKGGKLIGVEMGKLFGNELIDTQFSNIDIIHPVPLHYKKLKKRGYNQSELIAAGISSKLKKPIVNNAVKKQFETETQTNKSRFERWQNVKEMFEVTNPKILENRHVLLIDDVVTTGSTLEACANEILKIEGARVSIATLAVAKLG